MNFIPPLFKEANPDEDFPLFYEMYSIPEQKLLSELKGLFGDLYKEFEKYQTQEHHNKGGYIIKDYCAEDMSFDGFYPGYMGQKIRILYVAREGRGLSGCNYLENLYPGIKENKVDGKSLRNYAFHRRILYLTYALQKGEYDFEEIPYPERIIGEFGTDKISYAFMNISKFSNDEPDSSYAYDELISKSVEISTKNRNYIREQINLLNADIIITMNLGKWLKNIGDLKLLEKTDEVNCYEAYINNHRKLVLDTYHFSSIFNEKKYFFDSIIEAILRHSKILD